MSYEHLTRRAIFNENGIVISLGGPFDNGTDEQHPTRMWDLEFGPIIEAFPEYANWQGDNMANWQELEELYQGMVLGEVQYQHDNGISVERQHTLEAQVERIGNPYY